MEKQFIVSGNLIQEVINYLQERPFKEVAGLIQALASSVPYVKESE